MPSDLPAGRRAAAPLAACAALAVLPGCLLAPHRFVAERAPPPADVASEAARASPPLPEKKAAPVAPAPATPGSLADLVDLALSQDPATRAAWLDARAAAAAAGSRRSLYLPTVDVSATFTAQRPSASPGRPATETEVLGASGRITWILLDLGGRSALVNEADRLLAAARLSENAAVADLVLRVQQTYYQYLAARALVESEGAAVKQAETSLEAAEGRRRAGIATVAEVLQARTALSQAMLTLQQLEGQALALRGALATLVGLPPTAPLDGVGTLPAQVNVAAAQPAVDDLIAAAEALNPDLGRARALADASEARARAASRAWAPVLGAEASRGWSSYLHPTDFGESWSWSASLFLRIPAFQGLAPAYDAIGASAQADAARARADATEQRVALGVWTSFQGVRTAARSVETSRDLLASARASAEVATGRYKEGVGSILDLLAAQAALENALALEVRARADYLVSLAQLARATGRLDLHHHPAPTPAQGSTQP